MGPVERLHATGNVGGLNRRDRVVASTMACSSGSTGEPREGVVTSPGETTPAAKG